MFKCYDLVTEYQKNPICVDEKKPQFSWKLSSDEKNVMQSAYQIVVDGMWDSGKVLSDSSTHVEYDGKELKPKTRYNVKVKLWDNHGNESEWSEGSFETSFLGENLWKAHWIGRKVENSEAYEYSKTFVLDKPFTKARIYASAYGVYEIFINGKKVSDTYLAPGYTTYAKRLQYQVYEAEEYLQEGKNEIKAVLASGWCGRFPAYPGHHFKEAKEILLQLEVDGKIEAMTDDTWTCTQSKVVFSEIYDGETYDSTFKGEEKAYEIDKHGFENLVAQQSEPVRIIEEVKPVELIKTPKGETVIDFGQNLVGTVWFKVDGKYGDKVEISHAEILDKDGNFYNENYRSAKAKLKYVLNGENDEYHARYTFFGFRYIRIDEYPGEVKLDNFKALVMHTDMKRTGYFESSHKLLNRLFLNTVWGQKGNYVDIPTDCPQRDERLGWTGDTQVFCKAGAQNFNTALFFRKWLGEVKTCQEENGICQIIVPKVGDEKRASCGWSDAAVICPWEIYCAYGDKKALRSQYDSMKKWISYVEGEGDNRYLWNTGFHFGDWLAMDGLEYDRGGGTSKDFIASAFFAYSTDLVRKTAHALEEYEDEKYYADLHEKIVENINEEFITKTGRVCDNTQTANALAVYFDITKDRERAAKTLADLVTETQNRLSTGFLGTPYLCDALADSGYMKKAFDLLLGEEYPSWLFSVKMGATTIWEHWDGIKPDGTVWDVSMNSYNHYAYGAIADFMYKRIGGIVPKEAGYKKIKIQPVMDERITYAKTSLETMYGKIETDWKNENGKFVLKVLIPENTEAEIILPDGSSTNVGSGSYEYSI